MGPLWLFDFALLCSELGSSASRYRDNNGKEETRGDQVGVPLPGRTRQTLSSVTMTAGKWPIGPGNTPSRGIKTGQ